MEICQNSATEPAQVSARPRYSLVVPFYNEDQIVRKLYEPDRAGDAARRRHSYEMIFINDGSRDDTGEVLERSPATTTA